MMVHFLMLLALQVKHWTFLLTKVFISKTLKKVFVVSFEGYKLTMQYDPISYDQIITAESNSNE